MQWCRTGYSPFCRITPNALLLEDIDKMKLAWIIKDTLDKYVARACKTKSYKCVNKGHYMDHEEVLFVEWRGIV